MFRFTELSLSNFDSVDDYLDQVFSRLRFGMLEAGYVFSEEFYWPEEYCPCCKKSGFKFIWVVSGRAQSHISCWYADGFRAIIYYWLCRGCSIKSRKASANRLQRMEIKIQRNTSRILLADYVSN